MGTLRSAPLRLDATLVLPLAGFPSEEGNRLLLRSTADGSELVLRPPNPGAAWVDWTFQVPSEWVGREVHLVAEDARTAERGWFALAPPTSRLEAWILPHVTALALGLLAAIGLAVGIRRGLLRPAVDLVRRDPYRAVLIVTALLLGLHWIVVASFAVDVPILDEWSALSDGALGPWPSGKWLFGFHNEHRILPTRLYTWALYRLGGLNLATQTTMNFVFYIALFVCLRELVRRHFDLKVDAVALLVASTVASENHIWAFQSQFHFFLLFFVVAIDFALRGGAWAWWSCVAAVACAYSFSSGVICAGCVALFYVYLAATGPQEARRGRLLQAGVVLVSLAFWFYGFHKMVRHPAPAFLFGAAYWSHFLNLVSSGFGYHEISIVPGIVLLLLFLLLVGWRLRTLREDPRRDAWVGLLVIVVGLFGCLAAISLARAGFGPKQAKVARYAEISLVLLPCFWLLCMNAMRDLSLWRRRAGLAAVLVVLYAPFVDDYSFVSTYSGADYKKRLEVRRCIGRYYRTKGPPNCDYGAGSTSIEPMLQNARKLNVSFARELEK